MKLVIGELIESSGLKKRHISKMIGINENTLTNWIQNKTWPKLNHAIKLAEVLNCEVKDLYKLD